MKRTLQRLLKAQFTGLESDEALQGKGEERGKMAGGLGAVRLGDRVNMVSLKGPGCWSLSERDSP